MRTPTINSVFYSPAPPPNNSEDWQRYAYDEFIKLQGAIVALAQGHLDMVYSAPSKPREGDIRLADGTSWNPGGGKGVYCYYGAVWHLLG